MTNNKNKMMTEQPAFTSRDFLREDEDGDAIFYSKSRLVSHLDAVALRTVEAIIGALVVEPQPRILDLMASWDSHLPPALEPVELVGLGLNEAELRANTALTARVVHDLNERPELPFDDGAFDVVLNTVSVEYLTRPREVFAEVARLLAPGGLCLVTFSNRMFPTKAVRIWREADEPERIDYVERLLERTGAFDDSRVVISKGRLRPKYDKYASAGVPSDPVVAVFAARLGNSGPPRLSPAEVVRAVERALPRDPRATTLPRSGRAGAPHCPRCGLAMRKWEVPQTPFTEWDNDHMYICFNDDCPYLVRGWTVMAAQGNRGISYRQMFDPLRRAFSPVPVPTLGALKDGIID